MIRALASSNGLIAVRRTYGEDAVKLEPKGMNVWCDEKRGEQAVLKVNGENLGNRRDGSVCVNGLLRKGTTFF